MSSNLKFIFGVSCFLLIMAADEANAEDFIGPAGTPVASPKIMLNALMKHPSVPNFDRLRPMSGEWVRCKNPPSPAAGSQQDLFSSSDGNHFSRVTSAFSDQNCKAHSKETRTSWQCEPSNNELLSCKLLKEETGGEGGWSASKKSDDELAGSTIKISLKPIRKKIQTPQLEVRWRSDAADEPSETETFILSYRAAPAKTSKPAKN